MKYLFCILLCLNSIICIAGTRDPNTSDTKYIEYGNKHDVVLQIIGVYGDDLNSIFRASCVIIDEYHVLTAAHVVSNSLFKYVIYNNKAYLCEDMIIHDEWEFDKMGFHDIAICRLQDPIKLNFYPELYSNNDEKNKICSIAGYGFTGTFDQGFNPSYFDNKRRAGSNFIDDIENCVLITSVNTGVKTDLEFLIAAGDSGGGLFIDKKLAGIHSFVSAKDNDANSNYRDLGCHTRISYYVEWIKKSKLKMRRK